MADHHTDLSGQVAFVTGASSGLGRRFARVLADAGAAVALAARRTDRLDALAAEIEAAGGRAVVVPLDVADAAAIPVAIEGTQARLGTVSILINAAGIAPAAPAVRQACEDIDATLAVNVRAPFLLAREVARRLIEAGQPGRIVNISSIGAFAHTGILPTSFYSVSKAAVARMSEVLAVEWSKHHINVNTIAPGFFRSEMSESVSPKYVQALLDAMPRKRIGEPNQLDTTLLYLVSPLSEAVTGTTIKVDDGQSFR